MKKFLLYSLLFMLMAGACNKKEYPPDLVTDSEVTFYSKLNVNGTPYTLEAGRNNYYMYTAYAHDSNQVYNFIGELKSTASAGTAPNSLRIQINDYKVNAGIQPPDMAQALKVSDYGYYDRSYLNAYKATFRSTYNKSAARYHWDFGDGSSSEEANPVHLYFNAGNYKVSLKVTSVGGCVDNISNLISINSGNPLNASVGVSSASGNTVSFNPEVRGSNIPFTYLWDFGDGSVSTATNPTHAYAVAGSYPVKVLVKDNVGKTILSQYNAVTQSDKSSCAANFALVSLEPQSPNFGLSSVLVRWTDANGVQYSSMAGLQTSASNFKVLSVQDEGTNEKGEKIKKIKISFACRAYNGSQFVVIDNAEAVVALAYK